MWPRHESAASPARRVLALPIVGILRTILRTLALLSFFLSFSHARKDTPRMVPGTPRAGHRRASAKSMYEIAMELSREGVQKGRFRDPKLRTESAESDGTSLNREPTEHQRSTNRAPTEHQPGALLARPLPARVPSSSKGSTLARRGKGGWEDERRRLDASWMLFGVNVGLTTRLSLAALNASLYRYDSVVAALDVDWRKTAFMTYIQSQANCESCWAMAALDSVSIMLAISQGRTPSTLSTQQLCDCTGGSCCEGGWPEDAYSYIMYNGNITDALSYVYRARDSSTCLWNTSYRAAASITGWERVPAYSSVALMKAVSMHPVLVFISASSDDFKAYTSTAPGTAGFRIYNGNCNTAVNHAVLVVGYSSSGGYWILKNTWLASWGHNGHMYIDMQDGEGKCGMLSISPLYPINYPTAPVQVTVTSSKQLQLVGDGKWWKTWIGSLLVNPCAGVINPCGGGYCYNGAGIARCLCPSGYAEVLLVPTSKCIPVDVCNNGPVSPCGAGACVNVGDGTYICRCSPGFLIGSRADGAPTCVPSGSGAAATYLANYGDTCAGIQSKLGMSASSFGELNPLINCSFPLIPGAVVAINASTSVVCTNQYAVRSGDTCDLIAWAMLNPRFYAQLALVSSLTQLSSTFLFTLNILRANRTALLGLNPTLDCTSLYLSQPICINGTANATALPASSKAFLGCGNVYVASSTDSCASVAALFKLNSSSFLALNPGLSCNYSGGTFSKGFQLCVAPGNQTAAGCNLWYTVKQGDSCAIIWNAASLSQSQFQALNSGLRCQTPYLVVGEQVCINSSTITAISDPGFFYYSTQPNDTIQTIQADFASKCQAWSISPDHIASFNAIGNWSTFNFYPGKSLSITVPCVPRIGASCGCAPSLYVCGTDGVTYPSYCDAVCNFATPVTSGTCSACRAACAGRAGLSNTACGGTCPYPAWPPPYPDASQQYPYPPYSCPQCEYTKTECQQVCTQVCSNQHLTEGSSAWTSAWNQCYSECFNCARVPCNGPSVLISTNNIGYLCSLCGSNTRLNTTMCSQPPYSCRAATCCDAKCSFFQFYTSGRPTHF